MLTGLYLFWSQKLHPIPLEKPRLAYSAALVASMVAVSGSVGALEVSAALVLAKTAMLLLIVVGGIALGIVDLAAIRGVFAQRLRT